MSKEPKLEGDMMNSVMLDAFHDVCGQDMTERERADLALHFSDPVRSKYYFL
jgi:hypothetical protein